MKFFIALLLSSVGFSALAHEANVSCTPKFYSCQAGNVCGWQNMADMPEARIEFVQDLNYPAPHYPYEVWRGGYRANYDGHVLFLDLVYSTVDKRNPISVNASLSTPNVIAESSGKKSVNVALRNGNYGRGFSCTIK